MASTTVRCYRKAEECCRFATFPFFLHSGYDITLTNLGRILDNHRIRIAKILTHFDTPMLWDKSGTVPILKMNWEIRDGRIYFFFTGDHSMGYSHDFSTYIALLRRNFLVTPAGKVYVLEQARKYTGAVEITLTRCSYKPKSIDVRFVSTR